MNDTTHVESLREAEPEEAAPQQQTEAAPAAEIFSYDGWTLEPILLNRAD